MDPNQLNPEDIPDINDVENFATNWTNKTSRIVDLLLNHSIMNAGYDLNNHPPIMMRTHNGEKSLVRVFTIEEEDIMVVENTESNTLIRTCKPKTSPQDNGSRSRRTGSYISTTI